MATLRNLITKLGVDSKAFEKGMKRAGKKIKGFRRSVRSAGNILLTYFSVRALGGMVKSMTAAASAAEEVGSKFIAVFKKQTKAAETFVRNFGAAVGRGQTELKSYMATLQDTFVPLGFARDDARRMSQTLTRLAIDLASFNNTTDEAVIRDLQSALVGNHETMRKYGVIITQVTLGQELLRMGFIGGVMKATEQQKALARLNLILAGTSDAQGDAARTADSFANQMKRAASEVQAVKESMGSFFTDVGKWWAKYLGRLTNKQIVRSLGDIETAMDFLHKSRPKASPTSPLFDAGDAQKRVTFLRDALSQAKDAQARARIMANAELASGETRRKAIDTIVMLDLEIKLYADSLADAEQQLGRFQDAQFNVNTAIAQGVKLAAESSLWQKNSAAAVKGVLADLESQIDALALSQKQLVVKRLLTVGVTPEQMDKVLRMFDKLDDARKAADKGGNKPLFDAPNLSDPGQFEQIVSGRMNIEGLTDMGAEEVAIAKQQLEVLKGIRDGGGMA